MDMNSNLHMNKCVAGVQQEWWCHKDGCGSWFSIYRDTTTNLEKQDAGGQK
jgi:sarcosine oxidase delta subunit